tara:strand:- start:1081 stop:1899 length:819 start_codon:yes stop_codon:yes gene_type:complete
MRNLTKAIFFSLFFLFSLNLYSLEIYQADCKNVEKGVQDIWKFEIDDESSYEAIKLQTQEFGIVHDNTTLNDESISFDMLYDEGGSGYFEFFFEGPNAGLIFKDKGTEPLQGFFCEWSSYYADASESNVAVDNSKPHIIVELISYEDKQDYEDKPVCELEFTVTNNSFGTMYDYRISAETFDDRGDKMDEYAMDDKIDAFGDFWSFDEDIKVGNSATSKSLQLKGKCSYVQDIYMTEVKNRYCNIRMLPDGFDCLSLVQPVSKIDHINLQFK